MTHPFAKHRFGGAKAKAMLGAYKLPDFAANGAGQPMVPKTPMAPPTGALGACPNSRCSILSESDSSLSYEQVFSPLEYRSDTAAAAECAGLRAERPCLAVYR